MPYFSNDNINILFIHIPKTGGTSVENYFSSKYNIALNNSSLFDTLNDPVLDKHLVITSTLQHITYTQLVKYKTDLNIIFDNIKIISVVRNPYERIISDLFYLRLITVTSTQEEVFNVLQQYISLIPSYDNHNLPQYIFLINESGEIDKNLIILKTETLVNDMHNIGYTDFNLCDNSNTYKVNYYDYLNYESIKIINDVYDSDFKLFGYDKKI